MPLENCQFCQGTGWKLVARKDGPGKFAVACDCGIGERAARTMERARIPKRYEHCDFESYVTDLADGKVWTTQNAQSLKQTKLITQAFVREYPAAAEKGLLLMGPAGVGKTHIAVAALKELIKRGHSGYFCEYGALLREIQKTYSEAGEQTESRIVQPLLSAEVLVIDDLGCIKPSDWVRDTIGYILNSRYSEASRDLTQPRCTIITTNYFDSAATKEARDPSGRLLVNRTDTLADRIGERMRSRLLEICRTVEIDRTMPDFRRELQKSTRARA
jgi:DNA replication protein DnaC